MRVTAVVLLFFSLTLSAAAQNHADAALNCIILPDEQVELGSPVPGVIQDISVRRSDSVRAGQPIARLESSVEQATVALARARAETQTEIELRRVEYAYDAQHRDRLNALQARQAVSSQNLEDAERVAEAAQLRVRLAQDRRREAMLDKQRADAMLALKTIVSPIDGVVVQLHNRVGEYVETRPVARIARLDPLRVEVIAPLALFGSVREGMQVAVRPETDPDHERVATVTAVDAVADPGSGTFGIEMTLPNPGLVLPAGIKCTGRLLPPTQTASREPDHNAATEAALAPPERAHLETPDICLAFGPQDNEQQARDFAAIAKQLGAQVELNEVEARRVIGYVVVTQPEAPPEGLNILAARMRDAGIADLAIMGRGEYAGRIALGTYNGPLSAERRNTALRELGFDTEVLPRTRKGHAWQVEVRLPQQTGHDTALAQLERAAGGAVGQSETCDPMLTAAR